MAISSATGAGLKALVKAILDLLDEAQAAEAKQAARKAAAERTAGAEAAP
jgi:hypothetical protein